MAAETVAAKYLEKQGYRIVARNVLSYGEDGKGELDVVAWEGSVLCFIEVRSRASERFGTPEETIDWRKRRRIIRAARRYLDKLGRVPPCRFDVVAIVTTPPRVTLYRDAFRVGGAP